MATVQAQTILRDPQLFYWILFPITVVMVLTGVLRHYATVLMQSDPKKQDLPSLSEQRNLLRGINLRTNHNQIPLSSFLSRKNHLVSSYTQGAFLADPSSANGGGNKPPANPMTDPAGMEQMMSLLKSNMAMMIPQTLIMGWINAFFSGFVIMKLPFPLTLRFKSMLQTGVATRDLDVRWVSSLSWYFLNLFGLRAVFSLVLGGDNNAVDQVALQMQQGGAGAAPGGVMFGPGQDVNKMFLAEAENLEVVGGQHEWVLEGVLERVLVGRG